MGQPVEITRTEYFAAAYLAWRRRTATARWFAGFWHLRRFWKAVPVRTRHRGME